MIEWYYIMQRFNMIELYCMTGWYYIVEWYNMAMKWYKMQESLNMMNWQYDGIM